MVLMIDLISAVWLDVVMATDDRAGCWPWNTTGQVASISHYLCEWIIAICKVYK